MCAQELHVLLQPPLYCSSSKRVSCVQGLLAHGFFFLPPVYVTSVQILIPERKRFMQNSVVLAELHMRNMRSVEISLRTGG